MPLEAARGFALLDVAKRVADGGKTFGIALPAIDGLGDQARKEAGDFVAANRRGQQGCAGRLALV